MDITLFYIWGGIGAAFFLFIGALIGFTVFERRFVALQTALNLAVERNKKYFTQLGEAHENLHKEYNVVRELEISLLHAGMAIEAEALRATKAEDARMDSVDYRKAIIQALIDHDLWNMNVLGDTPAFMLTRLMTHVAECAVDPTQNQKAKNLYVKGVRAGAKKGRAQMQKIMQKSVDNQANSIELLRQSLVNLTGDVVDAQDRYETFRKAVSNTLTDKVGLVSVRRAIVQGIAAECARLRAVEAKKGE